MHGEASRHGRRATVTIGSIAVTLALLLALGVSVLALGQARGRPLLTARTIALPPSSSAVTTVGSAAIGTPAVVWVQTGLVTDGKATRAYVAPDLVPIGQGSSALSVYTVDLHSHRVLARADLSSPLAALVPDPSAGCVLLLQPWSLTIGAIDAQTGRLLPSLPLGFAPDALAAVPHGRAYAAGLDNRLRPIFSVVNTHAGRVQRTALLGVGLPVWLLADAARNQVFAGLASETLVGGTAMTVLALDGRTGRVRRAVKLPGVALAALDPRRALLYLVGEQWARVIDARSGRTLRALALPPLRPLGGPPPGSAPGLLQPLDVTLALDQVSGRVAVLRPDSMHVALLDAHGVARTLFVGAGVAALAAGGGRIIAVTAGGKAIIFNVRSGSAEGTIAVPSGTGAALAAGHALLFATPATSIMPSDAWAWLPAGLRQRLPGVPRPPNVLPVAGRLSMATLLAP